MDVNMLANIYIPFRNWKFWKMILVSVHSYWKCRLKYFDSPSNLAGVLSRILLNFMRRKCHGNPRSSIFTTHFRRSTLITMGAFELFCRRLGFFWRRWREDRAKDRAKRELKFKHWRKKCLRPTPAKELASKSQCKARQRARRVPL